MSQNIFQPSKVLVGGAILPALAVPAGARISARLKRVQEHSSPVNIVRARTTNHDMGSSAVGSRTCADFLCFDYQPADQGLRHCTFSLKPDFRYSVPILFDRRTVSQLGSSTHARTTNRGMGSSAVGRLKRTTAPDSHAENNILTPGGETCL